MKSSVQIAFTSWIAISFLVVVSVAVIDFRYGPKGFDVFILQGPLTNLNIALASTALTWFCAGLLLYLLANNKINTANIFTVAGFFIIMFSYLNILRERLRYGDYGYYIEAATALLQHKHLPDTYFYLPLWATILQFIIPLGDQGVLIILWVVNIFALGAFYLLLHRLLERYGFSPRFAALTTALFILINVPIQRALGYVQVDLLVMICVMLSILLYPKQTFLSALTLALAVHLKTSPVVLVLAFLLERDWRWLAWFTLSFLVIAAVPLEINGAMPYYDFLHNIQALARNPDTTFHDTSFDSFLGFLNPFLRINVFWTRIMVYLAKAALGVATIIVMALNVRNQTFVSGATFGNTMLNAIPPLFVLMTLASPLVWEHHAIFVTLPFLLILKRIELPGTLLWFGFTYYLEFIMPTFDFFPWSYGRLVAPLIVLALTWRNSRTREESSFFGTANAWFANLPI